MDVKPNSLELKEDAAFRDATTVAIVLHGVGDHTSVDILHAAVEGPESVWGDQARLTEIEVTGLPMPREVDMFGFRQGAPVALEILVNSERHILLPVIWSGVRRRAGRWAGRGEGPMALWGALPLLLGTSIDLFRCVPLARGAWKLGVLLVALLIGLFLGGLAIGVFYLSSHIGFWLSSSFNPFWFAVLSVGSFALLRRLIVKVASALDLVGDVAFYVAHKDVRDENIEAMGKLMQAVAERAPSARVILVGHSLGAVLMTQSLLTLSSAYAGKGRTVLVTMGSPLVLMSRVFPRHVQSPSELGDKFAGTGLLLKWVNLWRTQDVIGQALGVTLGQGFVEASLGIGGHANYWGDERVWATIAKIVQSLSSALPEPFDRAWHTLPLTPAEEIQLAAIRDRMRLIFRFDWSLLVGALAFQMAYLVPWERRFSTAVHALILLSWNAGLIPLGLTPIVVSQKLSEYKSPRELLHKHRFYFALARTVTIVSGIVLTIISSICAFQLRPAR